MGFVAFKESTQPSVVDMCNISKENQSGDVKVCMNVVISDVKMHLLLSF